MVMVGVIANRRRRPIATDRRRVRVRRCRKAQRVLPETCERRDISRSNTRRRRPDEPQTERQHGECNAQRRSPRGRRSTIAMWPVRRGTIGFDPLGSIPRSRELPAGWLAAKSRDCQSGDVAGTRATSEVLRRRHSRPPSSACQTPIAGKPIARSRAALQQRQRQRHVRRQPEAGAEQDVGAFLHADRVAARQKQTVRIA